MTTQWFQGHRQAMESRHRRRRAALNIEIAMGAVIAAQDEPARRARWLAGRKIRAESHELAKQFVVGEVVTTLDGDAIVRSIDPRTGALRLEFQTLRHGRKRVAKYSPLVVQKK